MFLGYRFVDGGEDLISKIERYQVPMTRLVGERTAAGIVEATNDFRQLSDVNKRHTTVVESVDAVCNAALDEAGGSTGSAPLVDHVCEPVVVDGQFNGLEDDSPPRVVVRCALGWSDLNAEQRAAVTEVEQRVRRDRTGGHPLTTVMLEGVGGCGKTRLLTYLAKHRTAGTDVFYMTKQNKRVRDFIHVDYFAGREQDRVASRPPLDLCSRRLDVNLLRSTSESEGRVWATTVDKFLSTFGLPPTLFDINVEKPRYGKKPYDGSDAADVCRRRELVLLVDEYTMITPQMAEALCHVVASQVQRPLVLLLVGDRFQCGPVNWRSNDVYSDTEQTLRERVGTPPLKLGLTRTVRCADDERLGALVRRLRSACERGASVVNVTNTVARFCRRNGVPLYGVIGSTLKSGRVVFDLPIESETDVENKEEEDDDDDEVDERQTSLKLDYDEPVTEDMTRIADSFAAAYKKLYTDLKYSLENKETQVNRWFSANAYSYFSVLMRDYLPRFIVVKNSMCNQMSVAATANLYSAVFSRVQTEIGHLEYFDEFKRRVAWSIPLGRNASECLLLMVGCVYKYSYNFSYRFQDGSTAALSRGEPVVVTHVDTGEDRRFRSVTVRPLLRNDAYDFVLEPQPAVNRVNKEMASSYNMVHLEPFYCENIYQMQGNTVSRTSSCFVDLRDCYDTSAVYVAMSRFQTTAGFSGVVLRA